MTIKQIKELSGYTLNLKGFIYLPIKAISLVNFVNSRNQVQAKNVGHYLDPCCLITYLYSWKTYSAEDNNPTFKV